jgi:trehalose 6-phosphate phosphatase
MHKGAAVERLLSQSGVQRALFGGDDRTDLDAFHSLRALADGGNLSTAVCIGIASAEAPPELARDADAVVAGPGEFLEVLRALARTSGEAA